MRTTLRRSSLLLALSLAGCAGTLAMDGDAGRSPGADARAPLGDGALDSTDDASTDDARDGGVTSDADIAADAGSDGTTGCRPTTNGRFGAPELVFEIPRTAIRDGSLYVRDVQSTWSDVDWSTLDRLYVPAGEYTSIVLGNLPQRSADRPLVITNRGGQVRVTGTRYAMSLVGGSSWVLTGRYDPVSQTGDPAFRGHAECAYESARGAYGFQLGTDYYEGSNVLSVRSPSSSEPGYGTNYATRFELEHLEIERAGFAGLMIKTDNQPDARMEGVRVHDLYIHDTISEGVYVGNTSSTPQHRLDDFDFHDNRVLRAGTECAQFGQLGRDSEIAHNVFALCAIDWRDSFQAYQDNGVQLGVREAPFSFHHNVVIGAASSTLILFDQPRDGDVHRAGDTASFHDLYLSSTRGGFIWLHAASDEVTRFELARLAFRSLVPMRHEIDSGARASDWIFSTPNTGTPIVFSDSTWDTATAPVSRFAERAMANLTVESSVVAGTVGRLRFRDFMPIPEAVEDVRIEMWTDTARRAASPPPPVTYEPGDYVVHEDVVYECLRTSTREVPPDHPTAWRALGVPVDDVRLAPGSPHEGVGLRDR
ncbi:MAG: right-handed parallel beta-helix repeat-containing protein [Myxococcota bacterium]|nr:right-handed parallel beta-helix repeat-containing protein [Myxococcota bacterium]